MIKMILIKFVLTLGLISHGVCTILWRTAHYNLTEKLPESIFDGNDVGELMALCNNCSTDPIESCDCDLKKCCDEGSLDDIKKAQKQVGDFQKRLLNLYEGLLMLFLWLGLLIYSIVMCCLGHWNFWVLVDPYEPNPVDGIDYQFYIKEKNYWQLKSKRNEFTRQEIEMIMEESQKKRANPKFVETTLRRY